MYIYIDNRSYSMYYSFIESAKMEHSIYSLIIKKHRGETGHSQKQVADILGVKQATVSRIESGLIFPSEKLAEKIKSLSLKEAQREEPIGRRINLNQAIKTSTYGVINVSHLLVPYSDRSGDYCSVDKLRGDKCNVILADSVGHGVDASRMSFALEFGYKTILSTINPYLVSPDIVQKALREAIASTGKDWLGPPALITGLLDTKSGLIEIINSGQPAPLCFNNNEVISLEPTSANESDLGLRENIKMNTVLKPGGSLALYTDGFLELFSQPEQQGLKERFLRAAKAFKGDSRAILINLLGALKILKDNELNIKQISDDITIMVITRTRDSR